MAPSDLERHDLEQDIDELRGSIASLESSRSRLRDVLPQQSDAPSGSIWSDLTEIVTDFFEAAGEAISEGSEDDDDDASPVAKVGDTVKKVVNTDWSKSLEAAFGRLRDRITSDFGQSSKPPVAELGGVLGELDAEISRLGADLQRKLDRVAEIDRSMEDVDPVPPVHHDDVTTTVIPSDDDIDVTPIPVDVLPDVDPTPVVPDDDDDIVLPTPDVHIGPVDITPIPDVITPVPDVHTTDDDTPAFDPGKRTEIGELDGAVYDVNEILANGHTVSDLRKYDVPAGVVRDAGVAASAMLDGGYSLAELHEAGCQTGDLHGLASASDLRAAGYNAGEMHGVFSVAECVDAFSVHELRDAGFTVSDFHGLVSASDLRDAFTVGELRTVYSIGELRSAGFSAADLSGGGVGWDELAAAGYSFFDIQSAGAGDAVLRNIFPHEFASDVETTT